jgi:DNA-directed RNA polymerase specialized sigma24 family protein
MTAEEYGCAFQRGYDKTVRLLVSRGVQSDWAREVAQTAWVRGLERLSQLRCDNLVVTWVNAIALNVYRRFVRKEATYRSLTEQGPDQVLPELCTPEQVNLAAIDIAQILRSCCVRDRTLLREQMSGFTAKEIAKRDGVTQTAIRLRMLRARRAARARVTCTGLVA